MSSQQPHPFSSLTAGEVEIARRAIVKLHPECVINFRVIFLLEPPKSEMLPFLELEKTGAAPAAMPRPARLAQAQYDVIGGIRATEYHERVIDLNSSDSVSHNVLAPEFHASLAM